MLSRNNKLILIALGLGVAVLISLLSGDSTARFETQFTEVASYRNPNNTGPVKRIYLVTVSQENHEEMLAYGGLQPHSKYGTTTVYFFPAGTELPTEISPQDLPLPEALRQVCLARYRKLGQGQERYQRGPLTEITSGSRDGAAHTRGSGVSCRG
jgi:hypothetical protein